MNVINIGVNKNALKILKNYVTTENVNYIECKFSFDEDWENAVNTAVFYQSPEKVYHVVLQNNKCLMPYEVLAKKGYIYIGVFGVDGNKRLTTDFKYIETVQGSYGDGTTPIPPTPGVYEQIMNRLSGVENTVVEKTAEASGYADSTHADRLAVEGIKSSVDQTKDEVNNISADVSHRHANIIAMDENVTTRADAVEVARQEVETSRAAVLADKTQVANDRTATETAKDETKGYRDEAEGFAISAGEHADIAETKAEESEVSALVSIEKEYNTSQDAQKTKDDRLAVEGYKDIALQAKTEAESARDETLSQKGLPGGMATLDSGGKVMQTALNSDKLGGFAPSSFVKTSDLGGLVDDVNSKIDRLSFDNETGTLTDYKGETGTNHSIKGLLKSASHNQSTGELTLSLKDGASIKVNIGKDKFCKSGYFDELSQEIVFVMNDDSEIRIDISYLVDIYVGGDTDTIAVDVYGSTIYADVILSADSGNMLQKKTDGLYVPKADLSAYKTKAENDGLYLGKTAKASDSAKLNGKTENQLIVDKAVKADKLSSNKSISISGAMVGSVSTDLSSNVNILVESETVPWSVLTPSNNAVTLNAATHDMAVMTNPNPVKLTINNLTSGCIIIVRIYGSTLDEDFLSTAYGITIPEYCKYIVTTNPNEAYEYIIESDGVKNTATRSVVY